MPNALKGLVGVIEFGEQKYTPAEDRGWLTYKPKEVLDSMLRHTIAMLNGEPLDPESGLPHSAHILFNAAVYLELTSCYSSEDSDEPKPPEDLTENSNRPSIDSSYDPRASHLLFELDPPS